MAYITRELESSTISLQVEGAAPSVPFFSFLKGVKSDFIKICEF